GRRERSGREGREEGREPEPGLAERPGPEPVVGGPQDDAAERHEPRGVEHEGPALVHEAPRDEHDAEDRAQPEEDVVERDVERPQVHLARRRALAQQELLGPRALEEEGLDDPDADVQDAGRDGEDLGERAHGSSSRSCGANERARTCAPSPSRWARAAGRPVSSRSRAVIKPVTCRPSPRCQGTSSATRRNPARRRRARNGKDTAHTRSAASRAATGGAGTGTPSATATSWVCTSASTSATRGTVPGARCREVTVVRSAATTSSRGRVPASRVRRSIVRSKLPRPRTRPRTSAP